MTRALAPPPAAAEGSEQETPRGESETQESSKAKMKFLTIREIDVDNDDKESLYETEKEKLKCIVPELGRCVGMIRTDEGLPNLYVVDHGTFDKPLLLVYVLHQSGDEFTVMNDTHYRQYAFHYHDLEDKDIHMIINPQDLRFSVTRGAGKGLLNVLNKGEVGSNDANTHNLLYHPSKFTTVGIGNEEALRAVARGGGKRYVGGANHEEEIDMIKKRLS